jgi:two-component system, response regulator PdtaR
VRNLPELFGPRVILVVEDDVLVRMVAVMWLVDAGFIVLEAEHADAALKLLHARAIDIHALFTDVLMPGDMDGVMLAHETKRRWPWIGLLIASAYTPHKTAAMPVGSRFLPKPYELDHVVQHLRELTGA